MSHVFLLASGDESHVQLAVESRVSSRHCAAEPLCPVHLLSEPLGPPALLLSNKIVQLYSLTLPRVPIAEKQVCISGEYLNVTYG